MGIVVEHKQYYNEKCTSRSRHYIIFAGTALMAATKVHAAQRALINLLFS